MLLCMEQCVLTSLLDYANYHALYIGTNWYKCLLTYSRHAHSVFGLAQVQTHHSERTEIFNKMIV